MNSMRQADDVLKRPVALAGLTASLALVAAAAYAPQAQAWGDEGHRIVALIAESYLMPSVRARVQELLATDESGLVADTSIESEATWADRYRDSDRARGHATGRARAHHRSASYAARYSYSLPQQPSLSHYEQTHRWHFVDLDLKQPDLEHACFDYPPLGPAEPASRGPAEDCVVDKIDQFEAELASPATDREERRLALQFLLHLVGDVHQPLHASTDHDEGGNLKHVIDAQGSRASLHGYWDVALVQRLGDDPHQVAAALLRRIQPADLVAWRRGRPADWALESYQVARRIAYGRLPAPAPDLEAYRHRRSHRYSLHGQYLLSDSYVDAATAAVATQLSRAGVRLALVLNRALQ
jgi:hypothetical protein